MTRLACAGFTEYDEASISNQKTVEDYNERGGVIEIILIIPSCTSDKKYNHNASLHATDYYYLSSSILVS